MTFYSFLKRPRLRRIVRRPSFRENEQVDIVQDENGILSHSYQGPSGHAVCGVGPGEENLSADDWYVERTEMYTGPGTWVVVPNSVWGADGSTFTKVETADERRQRELRAAGFSSVV